MALSNAQELAGGAYHGFNAPQEAPWSRTGSGAYGSKPAGAPVLPTAPINTGLAMNLGNNVYNQLPGYQTSIANVGQNVQDETSGKLPADVVRELQQRAAERGVATGTAGSDNNNAAYLRALGLTSLDLTNMGQSNLDRQLPLLPGAQVYQNPAFYPTSGQQYESQLQSNIFAAAPDPAAAGNANLRAAQSGYGVGRAAGPSNLPPTPGGGDFTTAGDQQFSHVSAQGGGGGRFQDSSTMDQINEIMRSYEPVVNGGQSPDIDPLTGQSWSNEPTVDSNAGEDYYDNPLSEAA